MASFSIPCPKTPGLSTGLGSRSKQNHHQGCQSSISLKSNPALSVGSSLDHSALRPFQGSRQTHFDAFKVCAQLNDVAIGKLSNSIPVPETKLEEPTEKSASNNIPDAASLSAFMTQVADLVELVDSRDIMELQLKQLDCEVLIRKKEALPQPPASTPVYMMQPPSSPAMFQSPLPPVQPAAPAAASSVPAPPVSALPSPAKPKSSHPPLKCPMAGTFYRSPGPGSPPFVKVGDKVQKGQVVCIIEAMKLMNEIEADHSGTLVEILVDDAKPVSVDMPLFIIEP